ncbi:SGNH/GDSL hydrolase family protein [Pedobacter gandavensis]|uniref:SGNH/GDSL hydrolase family protein n=1 Tax=Pedobacter gandavensis TaxID=2679963 RepID=UPI00293006F4|nr:SGNH/GDSL hydrolase family protein [Pedobacter gandavensis]
MFNNKRFFKYNAPIVFCILILSSTVSVQGQRLSDAPQKVLILGNSITWHGAKPAVGWSGNWGMAASAAEKDFVHLLQSRIKVLSPQTIFKSANIADSFERKFWNYDARDFEKFRDWNPDLFVLEIGENINDTLAVKHLLAEHLDRFVAEISGGKDIKVCLVGSFWPNLQVDKIMKAACIRNNWIYVDLQGLYKERDKNTAILQYQNRGVGMHPSDIGMENIANRIWNEIQQLFK